MARTILRGDQVVLTLDSVDYTVDAKSVQITSDEDDDATTFAGKAYTYTMAINGVQSDEESSLYTLLWENPGDIVNFSVKSNGTVGRTYTGQVRLPWNKPDFGGEAFSAWTIDLELELIGEPVRSALPGA